MGNLGCLWLALIVLMIGGAPLFIGLLRVFGVFILVTLIAGAAFSWWLRRHAVLEYTRTRRSESRRFVELLVALLVRLAEADGALDRREVTAIRHFFQHALGYQGEQLLWIRDLIKASQRDRADVSDLCRELREGFSLQERLIVLQVLTRVAEADGLLTSEELVFIRRVGQLLGLSAFIGAFGHPGFEQPGGFGAGGRAETATFDGRVERALAELGLAREATSVEIKQAWRKLSLENHPDRVAHLGEEFRQLAEERMRRINAAYDVLKQAGRAS